jgi:hypothetical protein
MRSASITGVSDPTSRQLTALYAHPPLSTSPTLFLRRARLPKLGCAIAPRVSLVDTQYHLARAPLGRRRSERGKVRRSHPIHRSLLLRTGAPLTRILLSLALPSSSWPSRKSGPRAWARPRHLKPTRRSGRPRPTPAPTATFCPTQMARRHRASPSAEAGLAVYDTAHGGFGMVVWDLGS